VGIRAVCESSEVIGDIDAERAKSPVTLYYSEVHDLVASKLIVGRGKDRAFGKVRTITQRHR
jgi:hypothetical protein